MMGHNKKRCITFDDDAKASIPNHILEKMARDRKQAMLDGGIDKWLDGVQSNLNTWILATPTSPLRDCLTDINIQIAKAQNIVISKKLIDEGFKENSRED